MGESEIAIHPMAGLMRRFAVDWLDRADVAVTEEIMAAGYTVHIGGVVLEGREAYAPATAGQLAQFPGLTITVHDVLYAAGDRAALRFTEHGASAKGGAAAWRGIGLFRAEGGQLVHNVVEEDYLARRRQLVGGVADPVDPPMVAPWTEPVGEPDPDAEKQVRAWLEALGPVGPGVTWDDARLGDAPDPLLEVSGCEVREVFSAGGRVAFHAVQRGRYAGGLPDVDAAVGRAAELSMVGLVAPGPDGVVTGHVVRDRLGLRRVLSKATRA
ncbi:nuclear transport factor 2 family protein [Pseudonocardia sp. RS010]|uniref:nuclear transport factor 2 family protein n=1 Tax=Pseudonocardia sp. RS010 TaxID=3385979 RepID=UPI00399F452A